jgi:hypothetical protein
MDTSTITEAQIMQQALIGPPPEPEMVKIVWANQLSPDHPIQLGINYQKAGRFHLRQVIPGAWSGESDHTPHAATCKVMAISHRIGDNLKTILPSPRTERMTYCQTTPIKPHPLT